MQKIATLACLSLLLCQSLLFSNPAQAKPKKMTETVEECLVDGQGREFCHVVSTQQVNADGSAASNQAPHYISEAEAQQKQREAEYRQMSEELERGNQQLANNNPQSAATTSQAELLFWDSIKTSSNSADFQAYLDRYPNGTFAQLARNRLGGGQAQAAKTSTTPSASRPAQSGANSEATTSHNSGFSIEMVSLPDGILMGKYEVTQGLWRAVMGSNPSFFSSCGDNCPVELVSWDDVQQFIQRLNSKSGEHFRLPTEDEWYSACQAGGSTEYCGSDSINAVAWYDDNSGFSTHAVGQKQANAWGLYDMSGNAREWTNSCYESDCSRRVLRGGSWYSEPAFVRSAYRDRCTTTDRSNALGFRLAQDP